MILPKQCTIKWKFIQNDHTFVTFAWFDASNMVNLITHCHMNKPSFMGNMGFNGPFRWTKKFTYQITLCHLQLEKWSYPGYQVIFFYSLKITPDKNYPRCQWVHLLTHHSGQIQPNVFWGAFSNPRLKIYYISFPWKKKQMMTFSIINSPKTHLN